MTYYLQFNTIIMHLFCKPNTRKLHLWSSWNKSNEIPCLSRSSWDASQVYLFIYHKHNRTDTVGNNLQVIKIQNAHIWYDREPWSCTKCNHMIYSVKYNSWDLPNSLCVCSIWPSYKTLRTIILLKTGNGIF